MGCDGFASSRHRNRLADLSANGHGGYLSPSALGGAGRYPGAMCNLYTWKMTAKEMRALKLHLPFIGTTWTQWEERQRRQNEPSEDVYPNKRTPVVK